MLCPDSDQTFGLTIRVGTEIDGKDNDFQVAEYWLTCTKQVLGENFSKACVCHKCLQRSNVCKYLTVPPSETAVFTCYVRQTNIFL